MPKHRFYIPPDAWNPSALALAGDELRHCRDVLRCRPGDRVVVFNGAGAEADAEILGFGASAAPLKAWTLVDSPRPAARITLGQAVPKGKNMDLIVQKATELGANAIVPLLSERVVVRMDPGEARRKQEKWQRVAIEACKQCGQNWLPQVEMPVAADAFLSRSGPPRDPAELRLVAALTDDARPLKQILGDREDGTAPVRATVLIGPEGDFTPAEVSLAVGAGFEPLSLGPIVLRSETAAIHALSVVSYELR